MTGSLRVKNGTYYAVISYKDEYGIFRQKWISTKLPERGNKKEAQKILNKEMELFNNGEEIRQIAHKEELKAIDKDNQKIKLMDYVERYVSEKKSVVSPSTYRGYMNLVENMRKFFKNIDIRNVDYHKIIDFNDYLRTTQGVRNVTVKRYKEVLSPALKSACRDNIITQNPYDFVPAIKKEKPKRNFYDVDELEALFAITDNSKIGLAVRVASYYGLRRSELLGLRWQSIDFKKKLLNIENKILNIDKQIISTDVLKTEASNRVFPLLPEVESLLLRRKEEIEDNKKKYGKSYNNEYLDYVFVDDLGKLMLPDYISHFFSKTLKKNKLKHIRFHDLRHSCASLLANRGVPMKYIQEWLGHASYNQTADTYSHLNFNSKLESASVISNVLSKPEIIQKDEKKEHKEEETSAIDLQKEILELREFIKKQNERQDEIERQLKLQKEKTQRWSSDVEM